jgi:spore maturation protein CgeB
MNGVNVEFFAFDEIMRSVGRKAMNARLLSVVQERKPDICFFVLFTDEFEKDTIRQITEQSGATTLGWFGDDHWRFSTFSRHYAPLLHWVLTTDSEAVEKYHALGCRHVIKTQWGVNHCIYTKHDLPADFDVTFIGQVHSQRKQIVRRLRQSGIDVKCWGKGWESGRLSQEEMITMYSRSKINLNFTESSVAFGWKPIAKIFLNRRADDSIVLNDPVTMMNSIKVLFKDRRPQIKGRNFEIPGSGGFLLTSRADNLEEYFVPGKEIVVFNGTDDLIEKVRYYLSHDDEREAIRRAGYLRAIREHTYDRRFREILRTIGYGVE